MKQTLRFTMFGLFVGVLIGLWLEKRNQRLRDEAFFNDPDTVAFMESGKNDPRLRRKYDELEALDRG